MRRYKDEERQQLLQVKCNQCGKSLRVEDGYLREEVLSVQKVFGYFSRRDTQMHSFDLCEECYDKWIATFALPVQETDVTEVL
jgi:hypothetical protein